MVHSARVEVDGDDARSLRHHRTLHDRQADSAEPEYGTVEPGVTSRYENRADAGGDAASEEAHLVERRFG